VESPVGLLDPESLCERGRALLAAGNAQDALEAFERALVLRADSAPALVGRARALLGLSRHAEEAANCIARALEVDPRCADAHFARGNLARAQGDGEAAVKSYDAALTLEPDHAMALNNRAVALNALGRLQEALESCDRAIALKPDFAFAHSNRASVLRRLRRPDEALASCDRALAIHPHLHPGLQVRSLVLADLHRDDEALATFDAELAREPHSVPWLVHRAVLLRQLKRIGESVACLKAALSIDPEHVEANFLQAFNLLLLGDFRAGWKQYEWRWKREDLPRAAVPHFSQPVWLGQSSVSGKTLLLHCEQGFGDSIQFCRYAALVSKLGARVVLEVPSELRRLFHGLSGVDVLVGPGDLLPPFDLHCPLASLPLAFDTTLDNIPANVPYIDAHHERISHWRRRLGERRAFRIGLAWSGRPSHSDDVHRSMEAAELAPLLALGCEFVSLQQGVRDTDRPFMAKHPQIRQFGTDLGDFAETAALTSLMDIVVSVDTSVAHLAGAMAKAVCILLPFAPDFRWMLDRDDCPWYPTARLFRQTRVGDWKPVVDEVVAELRAMLGSRV
jgi:tetratricopeptide (TPR) repeat protein